MSKNIKLVALLSSLGKKELKRLDQYMASDLHYKRQECRRMYDYLRLLAPDFGLAFREKPAFFSAVFPNQDFDNHRLFRTVSALTQDMERAFRHILVENKPQLVHTALASEYQKRHLDGWLNDLITENQAFLQTLPPQSALFYENLIAYEKLKMLTLQHAAIDNSVYNQTNHALSVWFIAEKLRVYSIVLSNSFVIADVPHDDLVRHLLDEFLPTSVLLNEPLIRIYFFLIKALQSDEPAFHELLRLLKDQSTIFTISELQHIYILLENTCAFNLRRDKPVYLNHLFGLYQQELTTGVAFDSSGGLRSTFFRNVVTVALRHNAYEWATQFVAAHKARLPETEREDVFHFSLANIHFHQKKYDETLTLLNDINYIDNSYKIATRILRLKTYYELLQTNAAFDSVLESDLAAFNIFIYRLKGLATEQKILYKNFVAFLQKIYTIAPHDHKKRAKILEKIKNSATAEKKWLEQILTLQK
jgi:hypothetical protein